MDGKWPERESLYIYIYQTLVFSTTFKLTFDSTPPTPHCICCIHASILLPLSYLSCITLLKYIYIYVYHIIGCSDSFEQRVQLGCSHASSSPSWSHLLSIRLRPLHFQSHLRCCELWHGQRLPLSVGTFPGHQSLQCSPNHHLERTK